MSKTCIPIAHATLIVLLASGCQTILISGVNDSSQGRLNVHIRSLDYSTTYGSITQIMPGTRDDQTITLSTFTEDSVAEIRIIGVLTTADGMRLDSEEKVILVGKNNPQIFVSANSMNSVEID